MRTPALFAIALLPTLVRADASLHAPADAAAQRPRPHLCVQLYTGAAEVSSREVEWQAQLTVNPQAKTSVRESTLTVHDANGREVARVDNAFMGPEPAPWSIGLGMSTNGGPTLPALPIGGYRAVWRVDGFESPPARFVISSKAPPPLVLDWRGCECGPPLVLHLYNTSAKNIDLLDALEKSTLIVDGKRHARQGVEWDGGTNLPPRRSWNTGLWPAEYGVTLTSGTHTVELELGGFLARVGHAAYDCAARP